MVDDLVSALQRIDDAHVTYTLNSKCLRVALSRHDVSVQIEVKTARDLPVSLVSNRDLARQYGLPPRLIPVVDYPVALADKMAAWNERRLVRDVYDIWFYLRMGVRPDVASLERRLAKPAYSRLLERTEHFRGTKAESFYSFLREWVQELTGREIEAGLGDYLPPDELVGLGMRFRAELAKL